MNELKHIYIYNPAGANYILGNSYEFPLTDSCERSAKVMGEDYVRLVFKSTHKVVFDSFSFIRYNGQTFFLRERYIPTPDGTFKGDDGEISTAYFSYDVKFVSVANMLDKYVCYRHVKVTNVGEWNEPEININGNLETMYKIIMGSIQQVAERLSDHMEFTSMLKTIPANGLNSDGTINTNKVKLTAGTKLLTFNFSGDKIANVCTTVANNFTNDDKKDTEWYITEDNGSLTLHFAKYVDEEYGVQYVSDYISNNNGADSFAHPQKSGGLKKLDYAQEWSGITNVIVPYGSTRNMTYQAAKGIDEVTQMQSTFGKRLRLKPNTYYYVKDKDGKDVSFLTDQQGAVRNTGVDTGIEEVRFYDEIYPQGHFRVTKVETKNKRQDGEIVPEYTVAGVAIDSNGNEIQPAEGFYPIAIEEGTTLSVRFEKGLLNGREFEIANKTRKDEERTTYSLKFTIVADGSLEDGTLIPSGNFIPREGDEFALFNMKMPEVYITAAEKELAQRVYSDLEEAVSKRPEVKCTTDPTSWDKEMALGYQFQVKSEKFNSEDTFVSRVISYSYKLTKPKDIQFNLASAIMQGTLSSMNDQIADVTHQAGGLEQRAINLSRRGWRDAAEMAEMVDSLAADMMLVGNEKYQFAFTAGIEIVNSNNQTTAIKIGEGVLQHTQDPYISDYTCQGWWSHGAITLNNGHTENGSASLVSLPDTPFYLYAVVGQNSDNISFELQDKEQDGEAYLLLGILSSAFMDTIGGITTNYRVFNRTNGYTQISGGTITTEQIQDAGRNLIIDFQSNPPRIIARNGAVIIGNIKFKASDEMTAEEQLAALGVDVSNALSAAEQATYMNMYDGGDISVSTNSSKEIALKDAFIKLVTLGCNAKFSRISETPLLPFSNSCIMAVKKGTDVSKIYLYEDNIYAYLNWGDEYTPTEECDFYVALAEKEYIRDYLIPNSYGYIEYDIREVWTISGISVIVRTSDAIQSAMQAIANEEDARTEALAAAVSNINGGIDELQKQIDGEVSSYFYDTAPIDEDETILTDIPPFNEWAENYILRAGVYVLKTGARNEFVNHIGDTYTNMEEYKEDSNGDTTTPLAGLSWRWCDATTVSPLPKQYITIRYTSNGSTITKQLHWHKIADSDAVKALQEAGRAQSTADHKSTIFTTQPSKYSVGDMWILMEDTRVGGILYKKGTILNSSAKSETFNYSHWSEDVKYIDEDIARQQAQQALDGLIVGGTNLIPAVGFSSSDSHQNITKLQEELYSQGVYQVTKITNDTPPASSYNITQYVTAGKTYVASVYIRCDTAPSGTSLTKWGLIRFYGKNASGANVTYAESNIDAEPKVGQWYQRQVVYTIPSDFDASKETINIFCYAPSAAGVVSSMSCIKLEEGNKATPTYNMPISSIAQWAEESLQQLSDMSNDGILTPQEKKNVSNEWSEIQGMYSVNSNNVTSLFGSSKPTEWNEYNTKYSNLRTYITSLNLGSGSNTTITKATFQTRFSEYYNADVNLQKAIAKKSAELEVAAMEIGGRNLLRNSATFTHVAGSTNNFAYKPLTPTVGLQPNTNYVFSVDKSEMTAGSDTAFTVYLFSSDVKTGRNKLTIPISSTRQSVNFKTTAAVTDTDVVLIYAGQQGTTAGKAIKLTNIKLEQGTKATDWTPAPEDVDDAIAAVDSKAQALEYLKAALTDGSTEIAGGLTMTNVLMLKSIPENGSQAVVTAGMSGLTEYENKKDNVLMWGGGTYEEAYAAANNDTYNTGNGTITTLLKKDGTGKIGIFKISETQAVVKTNQGEVLIDSTDNNGGVYVKNNSGKIKAAIVNGKVEDYAPLEDEVIVSKNVNITSDTYDNGVFAEGSSGTCTTSRSVTFNLKQYFSVSEPCYCKVSVKVYGRLTQGFYNTEYKNSSATIKFTMNGEAKSPLSNSIYKNTSGYAQNGISPDQYYMEISRPIQSTSGAMATYNNNLMYLTPNYNFEVKVDVNTLISGAGWCLAKLTGDLTFVIEVTRLWSYGYEPKTIVATDGVMSAYDNKNFFIVKNTSNGQKIYAKGLSNGADREAGSGELYVTSGFVDAFVSFLDEFYAYVDHVRTIGSNDGNADTMQEKITGIKNTLVDASGNRITDIIASS